jgi:hypothetical protein
LRLGHPHRRAEVGKVSLRIDGEPVSADYPQPRPDVKKYYPQLGNAELSGFVASSVALEFGRERTLDIEVVVRDGTEERVVHTRQVRVLWFDPATEMFPLRQVAPFELPEAFDAARLPKLPGEPVFVVGAPAQIRRAQAALAARGKGLSSAEGFLDLLKAITACHDAYAWYDRNIFAHFRDRMRDFAIGRFDFYKLIETLVRQHHARHVEPLGINSAYSLAGREQVLLVPLLAQIYPQARFLCFTPPFAATLDPVHGAAARGRQAAESPEGRRRPPRDGLEVAQPRPVAPHRGGRSLARARRARGWHRRASQAAGALAFAAEYRNTRGRGRDSCRRGTRER